jgi:hypothetical protein
MDRMTSPEYRQFLHLLADILSAPSQEYED